MPTGLPFIQAIRPLECAPLDHVAELMSDRYSLGLHELIASIRQVLCEHLNKSQANRQLTLINLAMNKFSQSSTIF